MRKTLLLVLLALTTLLAQSKTKVSVTQVSCDPRDVNFCMYWNTVLDVKGYCTKLPMFGDDLPYVDHLQDDIYIAMREDHYRIWVPEIRMMFTVRPIGGYEGLPLGDHCVMFINVLRDFRKTQHKG